MILAFIILTFTSITITSVLYYKAKIDTASSVIEILSWKVVIATDFA